MWPETTETSRTCLRSYFRMGKTVEWGAGMLVTHLQNHQQVFTPREWGLRCRKAQKVWKGPYKSGISGALQRGRSTFSGSVKELRAGDRKAGQAGFHRDPYGKEQPTTRAEEGEAWSTEACRTTLPLPSPAPWKGRLPTVSASLYYSRQALNFKVSLV